MRSPSAGQRDEARADAQEIAERGADKGYYPAFPDRAIEVGLGNTDAALDWLERAVDERHTGFYLPSADPIYDVVRTRRASAR